MRFRRSPGNPLARRATLQTAVALAAAVFVFRASFSIASPPGDAVQLHWIADLADPARTVVEATGLPQQSLKALAQGDGSPAQWQALFSATTETGNLVTDLNLPPLAGTYQLNGDTLRFAPTFPLVAGVTYRATFRPSALPGEAGTKAPPVSAVHRIPARALKPTTVVSAVYPSTSVLPENLLKFYLHFSAPMSRGHIYEHIHLRDAAGQSIELPFLEIDEELWNSDLTRLTLFLDPGRIKRGVKPLEEVGPSLEEGRSYTLVIDSEWQDGAGTPLREGFSKKFSVGPADREPLDPIRWTIEAPAAGSRSAVRIAFSESLDRALVERVFRVTQTAGQPINGSVVVGAEETAWSFVPETPWRTGHYEIQVPASLEDLAGNNIGKPFDVDLFERVDRKLTNALVTLPFAVN